MKDAKWVRCKAYNLKITPNDLAVVGLALPRDLTQEQINSRKVAMVAWIK